MDDSALHNCKSVIRYLQSRLDEAEETLGAIQRGEIDAVVVSDPLTEHRVYTLENADHPYRMLIEQIQEGAFTLIPDGTIFYCNGRLAEMIGIPQERVVGHRLQPHLRPEDVPAFERLLDAAHNGRARGELTLRHASGLEVPVNLSISRMARDSEEELLCGVLGDLTAQKLHLRELSEANTRVVEEMTKRLAIEAASWQDAKLTALGELAAGVAHDFANHGMAMKSGVTLFLKRYGRLLAAEGVEIEGKAKSLLEQALLCATRAGETASRLLDFARRSDLACERVDIARLLAEVQATLTNTAPGGFSVVVEAPPGLPALKADSSRLLTVLMNLIGNARDASPPGAKAILAASEEAPDHIRITVSDNGLGMDEATLARAKEPFFTTKPKGKGTGLGLSMAYGFAEQSGGHLDIESTLGQGTTVTMLLPIWHGDPPQLA